MKDNYGRLTKIDKGDLYGLPANENKDTIHILYETSISKIMKDFTNGRDNLKNNGNKERMTSLKQQQEWRGGSIHNLFTTPSMKSFNKEREKIFKTKAFSKITTKLGQNKTRKRRLNEHDGEYDLDKKWEVKPFSKADKGFTPVKQLEINVDFSFSAGVSPEAINNYGVKVASICDLLESYGITTKLYIMNNLNGNISLGGNSVNQQTKILIKDFGEYLPKSQLVRAFSASFFRRVCFYGIIKTADMLGEVACSSLGRPFSYSKIIDSKDGILNLLSHTLSTEDLIEEVEKVLNI